MSNYTTCFGSRWNVPGRRGLTPSERFWSRVNKSGATMPHMESCCWEWTAYRVPTGYGYLDGSRVHRIAWEATHGPIVGGLDVCHRCDNPACLRPDHLFLGDARTNARDMVEKGRWRGPRPEQVAWGEAKSKLSVAQVEEIRDAVGTQREIAERFGVNQSTVSRIKHAKRWTRLGGQAVA